MCPPPPHTAGGTEAVGYDAWCSYHSRAFGIPLLSDILMRRVTAWLFTCSDNVTKHLIFVTLCKLLPGVMENGRN